jgi:hypothetical protein
MEVSVPKEYNLGPHYESLYKDKFGVLEVKLREDRLRNLKSDLQRQQNIFTVATKKKQQFMEVLLFYKLLQINTKTFTDVL